MADQSPDLERLLDLGKSGHDIRPPLLSMLADLFIDGRIRSEGAVQHFVSIMLTLIDGVPREVRQSIARKLVGHAATPPDLVERLARDLPMSPPQPENEADALNDIFFAADPAERRLILLSLGASSRPYSITISQETNARLEKLALAHNATGFARELERALGISSALATRITADGSGEPLVAAAKALACPADMLHRILLFLNPTIGRSVERVYALAQLFDEVTPNAAHELIALWREAHPRAGTVAAQPATWPDTARSRSAAAPSRASSLPDNIFTSRQRAAG